MEELRIDAEDQIAPWIIEAMEGLEENGKECELTLYLPAPEESSGFRLPAVRAGEDIFTVSPLETDDADVYMFSVIRPVSDGDEEISYTEWEFPWIKEHPDAGELIRILEYFDRACRTGSFGSGTDTEIPEQFYERPRLESLYSSLAEIGAEPELLSDEKGLYIHIEDDGFTIRLSFIRADDTESWILVLECSNEEGRTQVFQIPEFDGVRDPEEYGLLLEAAERFIA